MRMVGHLVSGVTDDPTNQICSRERLHRCLPCRGRPTYSRMELGVESIPELESKVSNFLPTAASEQLEMNEALPKIDIAKI